MTLKNRVARLTAEVDQRFGAGTADEVLRLARAVSPENSGFTLIEQLQALAQKLPESVEPPAPVARHPHAEQTEEKIAKARSALSKTAFLVLEQIDSLLVRAGVDCKGRTIEHPREALSRTEYLAALEKALVVARAGALTSARPATMDTESQQLKDARAMMARYHNLQGTERQSFAARVGEELEEAARVCDTADARAERETKFPAAKVAAARQLWALYEATPASDKADFRAEHGKTLDKAAELISALESERKN
jgi:hypothetical protein